MKNNIQGLGVALVTPFDASGKVDYDALQRVVSHVTTGGVDYLVALGTTAETPTLSDDEKRDVLSCIKRANTGGLPLVVGIGGNSTEAVVRAFQSCELQGVDAILSVTPYYNRPSQEGLFQHYRCLALEAPLPIILYNVPSRTGVNMTAQTTLKLAHEVRNIAGIKEASGMLNQIGTIIRERPAGFSVITGDDALAYPLAAIGADGVISVMANAFPRPMAEMLKASKAGNLTSAAELHLKLLEITEAVFSEGSPTGIKAALTIKHLMDNTVRLPLTPCTQHLYEELEALMTKYGF